MAAMGLRDVRLFHSVMEDKQFSSVRNIRSLRKLVEVVDRQHSSVSIVALLVHTVMEALSIGLYIWASQTSRAMSVRTFYWPTSAFVIEVALNIVFFLEWVALIFVEVDKRWYLLSWMSLVNLITSVPMIILGIASIANRSWRYGWVPMYFRVWWLSNCLCLLVDYEQVARYLVSVYRQIARYFIRLIAVIVTCIGTTQIVESCNGNYLSFYDTTYMMVVTFSTIGFGDVVVRSVAGRVFMTIFVLMGIAYVLPLFQRLTHVSERRKEYKTFRSRKWFFRRRRHVIVCGEFSDLAVEVLVRNFYAGWRKYLDVQLVLMTPKPYSVEVILTAHLPWFKDRVTLMIGDPTKMVDLRRARAHAAEAIFLFGNARSFAYFQDYTVIAQSMAVNAFDSGLPQHLLLRRSRHVREAAPYAASVLELERLIHHLLGLSAVCVGAIPFVVNLLRTYEPFPFDVTLNRGWIDEYEYALRNDLYDIHVPESLRAKNFHELAREFFDKSVTLIGVIDRRYRVLLNPRESIAEAIKYLVIAKTRDAAERATEAIARESERAYGEEMLSVNDAELSDYDVHDGVACVYDETDAAERVETETGTGRDLVERAVGNEAAGRQSRQGGRVHWANGDARDVCGDYDVCHARRMFGAGGNTDGKSIPSNDHMEEEYHLDNTDRNTQSPQQQREGGESSSVEKDVGPHHYNPNQAFFYERTHSRGESSDDMAVSREDHVYRERPEKDGEEVSRTHNNNSSSSNLNINNTNHTHREAEEAEEEESNEALERIDDAYDYEGHFIVIDLSSAKTKDKESRYSRENQRTAMAHDILHVMMPIRQTYHMCDIVLLTTDLSFAHGFDHHWLDISPDNPVKYIIGCGLNTADLRRCNFHDCAGCVIFYSGDISAHGSTSAMSMLVVRSIHHILKYIPTFPIVVEFEELTNLSLFPPFARDLQLRAKAQVDFVFDPNYLIGNAISRIMIYPLLQRNLFMQDLTLVLSVLISGHNTDVPALSAMPLSDSDVAFDIYEDVVNWTLKHGIVPVALLRRINDPANPPLNRRRFVLTNPPRYLHVNQQDDAVMYIVPAPLRNKSHDNTR